MSDSFKFQRHGTIELSYARLSLKCHRRFGVLSSKDVFDVIVALQIVKYETMIYWILLACGGSNLDAHQWKKEVLYADNWRYLQRAPEALASKFQRMSASPYLFMRGNLSIQLGHWSMISDDRWHTSFLNVPDATMIPIFGDAHPENLMVCADPSQPISVEMIDLDAATHAPWIIDVRRALTAQRVFASMMDGCDEACQNSVAESWLSGFWNGIESGDLDVFQSNIIVDLIEEALEEGGEAKKYHKYTTDERLNLNTMLDEEGKGILALEPDDRVPYEIFDDFAATRSGTTRLLDVAQRFGMGISSHAALRYVFVWDEGEEGEADNHLLLAREVFDPPNYPGRLGLDNPPFESNAHRVDALRRDLWTNPEADPNYMGQDRLFDYKTQTWSSYFQDVEVDKIQEKWTEGTYDIRDIQDLADVMGGLMAQMTRQSNTLSGRSSHVVILEDIQLGGGRDVLFEEIMGASQKDFVQLQMDFQWFQKTLQTDGPLLGLDVVGGDL